MRDQLRIMAVYAHPDDEIGVGGTLAKYAHADADITLVCATRGEAATIYCADCATPDTLAQVRTRELECSCKALGIERLQWLDWPDGAVDGVSRERALAQLVPLIRSLRPHVLLTHPEHGNYPHPDHIGVHHHVMAAYRAAADQEIMPGAGQAWPTPKLYVRQMPESFFDLIPGFRQYRVHLNGQALSFFADADETIDCVIDCSESVNWRIEGWQCHRSQHNPNGTFSTLPADTQQHIFAQEYFRLWASRLNHTLGKHTDLRAGLDQFNHD